MRWRFPIGLSLSESDARARALADIDAWWADLAEAWPSIRASFRREGDFDVASFMRRAFHERVHAEVMWEFGPHAGGGDFLALCPEARKDLVPLVDAALARAPTLEGLHLRRGRPPNPMEAARAIVRARQGGAPPARVRTELLDEHALIALTWEVGPGEAADQQALNRSFVATEAILGEEVLDTWIGPIDVAAAPKLGWFDKLRGRTLPAPADPVETLVERVDVAIATLREAMPVAPYGREVFDAEATLYRVEPSTPSRARRGDLMLVRTQAKRVTEATMGGAPFCSARHSRHGEVFAYLKIARSPDDQGREVEARARYEDALADALGEVSVGAVYGAGMGQGYAYVDLALTRPDDAIPLIRRVLQELDAPKECWLLFFDATLAEEWVGAWDDGPPPPGDETN